MRVLLDSHTLIWAADDPAKVTPAAMSVMSNPSAVLLVSVASVWEIAIKVAKGRLPLSLPFRPWIDKAIADMKLDLLPITIDHAERQSALVFHHKDPFDRLLAAQSLVEGIPLVSGDVAFDAYGLTRIW